MRRLLIGFCDGFENTLIDLILARDSRYHWSFEGTIWPLCSCRIFTPIILVLFDDWIVLIMGASVEIEPRAMLFPMFFPPLVQGEGVQMYCQASLPAGTKWRRITNLEPTIIS